MAVFKAGRCFDRRCFDRRCFDRRCFASWMPKQWVKRAAAGGGTAEGLEAVKVTDQMLAQSQMLFQALDVHGKACLAEAEFGAVMLAMVIAMVRRI